MSGNCLGLRLSSVLLFVLVQIPAYAHQAKPPKAASCADAATVYDYHGKTVILDANVFINDPEAFRHFTGAKIVITAALIEELDGGKKDFSSGRKVREVRRGLAALLATFPGQREIKLDEGTTIVFDYANYFSELKNLGFDKSKADNHGYLAPALAYKNKNEDVVIVSDDTDIILKAVPQGITVHSYITPGPAQQIDVDSDLPLFEVSNELIEELVTGDGIIAVPKSVSVKPNEFVQFHSAAYPPTIRTIVRYVYERPVMLYDGGALPGGEGERGEFELAQPPIDASTLRVKLDHRPVPEIEPGGEDGYYYDAENNRVHFVGRYHRMITEQSSVTIEGQTKPHHLERIKTFAELGLWGLRARSLEQTLAMNLADALRRGQISCLIQNGQAGASKSFNFVLAQMMMKEKMPNLKTLLVRPPVAMDGHKHGFLPGGLLEKNAPLTRSTLDNINRVNYLIEVANKQSPKKPMTLLPRNWEIQDYGTIRGRSFADTLIHVDEAQLMSKNAADAFLTRGADGSRFVISGDSTQVDAPQTPTNNGLTYIIDLLEFMDLEGRSRVGYIEFKDTVRDPFAASVINASRRMRQRRN